MAMCCSCCTHSTHQSGCCSSAATHHHHQHQHHHCSHGVFPVMPPIPVFSVTSSMPITSFTTADTSSINGSAVTPVLLPPIPVTITTAPAAHLSSSMAPQPHCSGISGGSSMSVSNQPLPTFEPTFRVSATSEQLKTEDNGSMMSGVTRKSEEGTSYPCCSSSSSSSTSSSSSSSVAVSVALTPPNSAGGVSRSTESISPSSNSNGRNGGRRSHGRGRLSSSSSAASSASLSSNNARFDLSLSMIADERGMYTCQFCKKESSHKHRLIAHLRTHTGERPFRCGFCPKSFTQKGNLKVHERKHSNVKPFTCDDCGYSARQKIHVLNHRRRAHTGEKPFMCGECSLKFSDPSQLTAHRIGHKGKRMHFKCRLCRFHGRLKDLVRSHIEKKHPGSDIAGNIIRGVIEDDDEKQAQQTELVKSELEESSTNTRMRGMVLSPSDDSNSERIDENNSTNDHPSSSDEEKSHPRESQSVEDVEIKPEREEVSE